MNNQPLLSQEANEQYEALVEAMQRYLDKPTPKWLLREAHSAKLRADFYQRYPKHLVLPYGFGNPEPIESEE